MPHRSEAVKRPRLFFFALAIPQRIPVPRHDAFALALSWLPGATRTFFYRACRLWYVVSPSERLEAYPPSRAYRLPGLEDSRMDSRYRETLFLLALVALCSLLRIFSTFPILSTRLLTRSGPLVVWGFFCASAFDLLAQSNSPFLPVCSSQSRIKHSANEVRSNLPYLKPKSDV